MLQLIKISALIFLTKLKYSVSSTASVKNTSVPVKIRELDTSQLCLPSLAQKGNPRAGGL